MALSTRTAKVHVQDASLVPAIGSGPQSSGKALSSAASYTQARMHACLLARELQDSQQEIKGLTQEVQQWRQAAADSHLQLQQEHAEASLLPARLLYHAAPLCSRICSHCTSRLLQGLAVLLTLFQPLTAAMYDRCDQPSLSLLAWQ